MLINSIALMAADASMEFIQMFNQINQISQEFFAIGKVIEEDRSMINYFLTM